jgi:serine/threonine protein kinase
MNNQSYPTRYYKSILNKGALLKQGRYKILELVGQGGMGNVYKSQDCCENQIVAIKQINWDVLADEHEESLKEYLRLFEQEAKILRQLNHKGLPRFYDYFEEKKSPFLVMEFIEGQNLRELLKQQSGPFPWYKITKWGIELTEIFDYLHTGLPLKIIYRDAKPDNIILTQEGQLKLVDLGIARFAKPGKLQDTAPIGTPGYTPPELKRLGVTDERADIYSLGVTLYQLVTNCQPDTANTGVSYPKASKYNRKIPAALDALLAQMLEIDRNKRPASMQIVQQRLREISNNTFRPAEQDDPEERKPTDPNPGPTSPTLNPFVKVAPPAFDFGSIRRSAPPINLELTVSGQGERNNPLTGGLELLDESTWLSFEPKGFGPGNYRINLKADASRLSPGYTNWCTLRLWSLYLRLIANWPKWLGWYGLPVAGLLLLIFQPGPTLLVIGLAAVIQILALLFDGLAWIFVPGSKVTKTQLKLSSNGGDCLVELSIKAEPGRLQLWFGISLAALFTALPVGFILFIVLKRLLS